MAYITRLALLLHRAITSLNLPEFGLLTLELDKGKDRDIYKHQRNQGNNSRIPPPRRPMFKFGQIPNWLVLASMGFAVFSIMSTTFKNQR